MEQTNNGFIISEKDLELRGPGEFLGTRQSGMVNFLLADIIKDTKILEKAREEAFELVKNINDETGKAAVPNALAQELDEKFRTIPDLSTLD